jgi:hypothetical protein
VAPAYLIVAPAYLIVAIAELINAGNEFHSDITQ